MRGLVALFSICIILMLMAFSTSALNNRLDGKWVAISSELLDGSRRKVIPHDIGIGWFWKIENGVFAQYTPPNDSDITRFIIADSLLILSPKLVYFIEEVTDSSLTVVWSIDVGNLPNKMPFDKRLFFKKVDRFYFE